ncbi:MULTISPECIES: hypothetical protein [unclassified Mycobacterium]|uniref:DUF7802 domain-containing protein n=1 Tax=unclassified Mycobacterium TaxID=2642494 RepID=UPI0029C8490A|nr:MULTISPECIES: hypothetical protein [unclassified Mycobacterium]
MSQCNETFDRIAGELGGFTCHDAPSVIHLRNPLALTNWTLPVLEAMMVFGAVLALWWAIRRLRREGDPTNLVLWVGSIVYLLVTEIPLYFPDVFGIQDQIGVVFDHNVFTVQFLYERLPLYIVALYPAVTTLAFEIVRSLGTFRRHGIVVGAVCVGFVHHCFYEVFDQLGPQLRWWQWNTDNPLNHPFFSSVPMTSVVIFATLGPAVLTFLTMLLVGRHVEAGRRFTGVSLTWRTLVAGALVVVGVGILSVPSSVFGGDEPNTTAQAVVFAGYLALFAIVAVPVLVRRRLDERPVAANPFVQLFGPLYLGVLALLWLSALPAYFGAVDGVTGDGTPTGTLSYAVACFVIAGLAVAAAWPSRIGGATLQNSEEMSRSL